MTFELTWRSRSRSSSGGAQMKAMVCPTYPSILINSSRMICGAQMHGDRPLVLLYSYLDDLMESGRRHPCSILMRNGAVKTVGCWGKRA